MSGGTTVSAPPPDPNQQALEAQQAASLKQQTDIITQQYQQQQLLDPVLLQSMGITATKDASGNITGYSQAPPNPNVALQNQATGLELQQTIDAIQGKLPVNPQVSQLLQTQQGSLNNQLQASLGPGYASSTPGISAQNLQNTNAAAITYGANTGQMTLDQQLALAGQQTSSNIQAQNLSNIFGITNQTLNAANAFGANAQGYGQAQQPFQFQQSLEFNAAVQSAQSASAANAASMGLAGAGIGAAAGVAAIAIF